MISSLGLGSNLDLNGIIEQLIAVESLPLSYLAQQEGQYQAKLSSLGQIKSALATFESAAQGLSSATETGDHLVTVEDNAVLTATASTDATAGEYSITVNQLAAGQILRADGQADATAAIGNGSSTDVTISFGTISGGTFDPGTGRYTGATFTVDTSQTPLNLTIDSSNNTLEGIRDAINALGSNVTAEIVDEGGANPYRLTITNSETGISNSMMVDVAGDKDIRDLLRYEAGNDNKQQLTQSQAAADAELNVDGTDYTRSNNTLTDVISGVTLTLKSVGSTSLTLSQETGDAEAALEALVSAYNDLDRTIKEATGLEAILQGDRATVYTQNRIRAALGRSLGNAGQFSTLSEVGVRFQRDGSLQLDKAKLESALETSSTDVTALIAAFRESLTTLSVQLTGVDGPLNTRTDGINRSISDINDRRDVLNRRLESTEARLRAQFTALDSLLSGLLATSNFLDQQLANLPKILNQSK